MFIFSLIPKPFYHLAPTFKTTHTEMFKNNELRKKGETDNNVYDAHLAINKQYCTDWFEIDFTIIIIF